MSDSSLSINRRVTVTVPYGEQDEFVAVRKGDLSRINDYVSSSKEPMKIFSKIGDIIIGVVITSTFSLWQLWETITEFNKLVYWVLIFGGAIFFILCLIFENLQNKDKNINLQMIQDEISGYLKQQIETQDVPKVV